MVKICLQCKRPWFDSWVGKIPWRKDRLPTPVFLGFSSGSAGKESACNAGDLASIPGLGRSAGEGNSFPLRYSGLENSMDSVDHGVLKSWTRLSDFTFTYLNLYHGYTAVATTRSIVYLPQTLESDHLGSNSNPVSF